MPERNWKGKSQVVNHVEEVPFRLLRKTPESSEGPADSGNMLLHGDNLEALKGLLPYYRNRDGLENVVCWYRNADKGEFALQGYRRPKFNPDFIAFIRSGKIAVLEWKGSNLVTNEETLYKEAPGDDWEALDPDNRYFRIVGDSDVHEILREVAAL